LVDDAVGPVLVVVGRVLGKDRSEMSFVKDQQAVQALEAGVASPLLDFPFDTTRTAVQLVLNGIVDRYPGARIIVAHAGGFLPYAAMRFAELAPVFRNDVASPADIHASFRRFCFDTALSAGPALPSLRAFAGRDHVTSGL
jgi:predicted TIM-barrel fold metal-dependent hydrolase